MRLLLSISILLFCCSTGSYGQKTDKKKTGTFLPVLIRYSDKVAHPPDSVTEFIKTYFSILGVPVIDSNEVSNLIRNEVNRAWDANYKKGDPMPRPDETFKWMKIIGYNLTLSIYTSPQSPEFKIDRVRWSTFPIPPHRDMKTYKETIYPDKGNKNPQFKTLKETIDKVVETAIRKEDK